MNYLHHSIQKMKIAKWTDDPLWGVYQITSSYFCAGLVTYDDKVVEAAPIIGYMRSANWDINHVKSYVAKKNWKWEKIR